jgi:PIN domain nuclease of toxin-antitoxin system
MIFGESAMEKKKLLFDTHTFLWLDSCPEKLSQIALKACEDSDNELYLSVVSVWEIMIKTKINRLQLQMPITELIEWHQKENNLKVLKVELHHVYALESLPLHHKDPFDRLLMAQAISEQMSLISTDEKFNQYPVEIIW